MALKQGWRKIEKHDSYWKNDEAFADITPAALASYEEDGEGRHLEQFARNGKPTLITWRTLNGDQLQHCRGPAFDPASTFGGALGRMYRLAFRIGVSIEGMANTMRDDEGNDWPTTVRESAYRMLANEYVDALEHDYPGIVAFYGEKIFNATALNEKEKKASSPPSTQTPSSAAESIPATTEPSPNVAGA